MVDRRAVDRRALVTGASSGIGREFARQLANSGYAITAVARRQPQLETLLQELPGQGHSYEVADLSTPDGVDSVGALFDQRHHDLLINNAGYSTFEPFYSSPLQQQRDVLGVNCDALLQLAHHFLRNARRGDALINLASIVAYLPTPAQPVYSASKAFIASFSECLWEEQRSRGVYVMGLCPGLTATEFIQTASGGESDGQNLPAALTQSTGEVVSEALDALRRRRKPIVVTGRANRAMVGLMPRLLSRFRLLKTLAVMGDPERAL